MSEEGDYVTFPWKNPSWDFASPDNSGNVGDRLGKKIACSSSHAQAAAEKAPDQVPTRKRSRDMIRGQDKNGQGELAANGGKTVSESDHEIHIWTERERRKKMRNMFANLHALLPHVPPKVSSLLVASIFCLFCLTQKEREGKAHSENERKIIWETIMVSSS